MAGSMFGLPMWLLGFRRLWWPGFRVGDRQEARWKLYRLSDLDLKLPRATFISFYSLEVCHEGRVIFKGREIRLIF